MVSPKKAALEVVDRLPDNCTWEDVIRELWIREKIECGIADLDSGRVVSHEEVFREFRNQDS